MCETCGCGDGAMPTVTEVAPHAHKHTDTRTHTTATAAVHAAADPSDHGHTDGRHTIVLEQRVLAKNDQLAARNRAQLDALEAVAVNIMGSPGAGKTTLLERTVRGLGDEMPLAVVEGDQETLLDADRIAAAGGRVVQINTGAGCHLDASMLADALLRLAPAPGTAVLVENVGNLVCPALFDLGAHAAVVLASVAEGADKPLKYPHMFRAADLILLTKTDIARHVAFDIEAFVANARAVHPGVAVAQVCATTGDGLDHWFDWLRDLRAGRRANS